MAYQKYKDIPNRREPLGGRDHIQHIENALVSMSQGGVSIAPDSGDGRTIALGDSITAGGKSEFSHTGGWSYVTYAALLSGGRLDLVRNAGVAGDTTAQMLARLQSDVIAHQPKRCVIMGGTNDVDMAGYSRAATLGNLTTIWDTLIANGIEPIACTIAPRGVTNWMAETVSLNAGITIEAMKRRIPLVDLWSAWVDPETGMFKSGYNKDSLHPTEAAAKVAGEYFWQQVEPLYATATPPILVKAAGAGINLITNGLFKDTDGNGVADNWTAFTSDPNVTHAIESDPDIAGNWQVHSRLADGSNVTVSQTVPRTWADGDVLEIAGRVATTDMAPGTVASIQLLPSGGATIEPVSSIGAEVSGIFRMRFTPPNGSPSISVRIRVGTVGAATVKVAQLTLVNLTHLGIA